MEEELLKAALEQRKIQGLKGTLDGFIAGAEWMAERMYTRADMQRAFLGGESNLMITGEDVEVEPYETFDEFINEYIR